MRRIVLFSIFVITILSLIAWIFWREEYRYSLPAVKPEHISDVTEGDTINLCELGLPQTDYLFIHFYIFRYNIL